MTPTSAHVPNLIEYPSEEIIAPLRAICPQEELLIYESLSNHSTFQIGGPAWILASPSSIWQIQDLLATAQSLDLPWIVIGCGSDLLFPDEGYAGLVIKIAQNFSSYKREGNTLWAQCGLSMIDLSRIALSESLSGFEFACGIPGSLGGGIYMNAGAYGGQISDVLESANVLMPDGSIKNFEFNKEDFAYRKSPLAHISGIILDARFRLKPDSPLAIKAIMNDLNERRQAKQPLELPSGGSSFKRPAEGQGYASALIDEAGLKGFAIGDAQISPKHAGFIVNTGKAKAADVLQLVQYVQEQVKRKFNVELEPELRIVHTYSRQEDLKH